MGVWEDWEGYFEGLPYFFLKKHNQLLFIHRTALILPSQTSQTSHFYNSASSITGSFSPVKFLRECFSRRVAPLSVDEKWLIFTIVYPAL